jgi:arabinofuranosyltransferase
VEHGIALQESGKSIAQENNIGFVGYYAGPTVHLVDVYALGDPLLARLPIPNPQKWRIGHFEREIPEGYIATLRTGENHLSDSSLAAFYDKLALITRGPLWDAERFKAIWEMNTGQYDDLVQKYSKIGK